MQCLQFPDQLLFEIFIEHFPTGAHAIVLRKNQNTIDDPLKTNVEHRFRIWLINEFALQLMKELVRWGFSQY